LFDPLQNDPFDNFILREVGHRLTVEQQNLGVGTVASADHVIEGTRWDYVGGNRRQFALTLYLSRYEPYAPYDPVVALGAHSGFWTEGSDFEDEGYSDTDTVTTWPNETAESDATATTGVTYNASDSNFNDKPSVSFSSTGDLATSAFSTAPDYTDGVSIIFIAFLTADANVKTLFDGLDATNRNMVETNASEVWRVNAGTVQGGSTVATGLVAGVAYFSGDSENSKLWINGVEEVDADAGSGQLDGLTIGARFNGVNDFNGELYLAMIVEGDVTSKSGWNTFKEWAEDQTGATF
jgi:hypothetical protein